MKTLNTLTTKELETTKALFAKYQTAEGKVGQMGAYYNGNKQNKAASTRAYTKLNNYLETIGATEKEAMNIIFNLTNA